MRSFEIKKRKGKLLDGNTNVHSLIATMRTLAALTVVPQNISYQCNTLPMLTFNTIIILHCAGAFMLKIQLLFLYKINTDVVRVLIM